MFVKGEKGTPQIRNFLFGENFVRKGGGGTPLTDKIRKVVFDPAPKNWEELWGLERRGVWATP